MQNPYVESSRNGIKIDLHRKIMEDHLGRKLRRDEHVHHINGDKRDNRLENLVVLSPKEHMRIHKQIYPYVKTCKVCGKEFEPKPSKRKRAVVCSDECKYTLDCENAKARKIKIAQYTISGQLVKIWDSARDVENELKIFGSNICKCCNGNIRSYKGYVWKYAE